MITINLLPQESGKSRRKQGNFPAASDGMSGGGDGSALGGLLVVLALVAAVAVNGWVGWQKYSEVSRAKKAYEKVDKDRRELRQDINKLEDEARFIRDAIKVLESQQAILKSINPEDRILWCEKLNMIANFVPSGVYISEILISEDVEMVETEASRKARDEWEKKRDADKDSAGPEPKRKMRPIISYDLTITGLATGNTNVIQDNKVSEFLDKMTTYEWPGNGRKFMDDFLPEVTINSIMTKIYEEEPVTEFTVLLRTKTQDS